MADYGPWYEAAGQQYNVDPMLLKAIATQESGENPGLTGAAGEMGMMQFMPATARQYGLTPAMAYSPPTAIMGAARYMKDNLDRFTDQNGNTNLSAAVAAYNGSGPAAQKYAATVLPIYQRLAGQRSAPKQAASDDPDVTAGKAYAAPQADHSDPDVVAGKAFAAGSASTQSDPDLQAGKALTEQFIASSTAKPPPPAPAPLGPTPTVDDLGRPIDTTPTAAGPPTAVSRIITAAAQGAAPAALAGGSDFGVGPETTAAMQKLGIFPPAQGGGNLLQNLNQAGANAIAVPVNLLMRGAGALLGGTQAGVAQAGAEIGQPQLGRDLAALPEAFPMGPAHVDITPPVAVRPNMLLPQEARAAAAATDANPSFLSHDFKANPTLNGNALVPAAVGDTVPNRLMTPQIATPESTAAPMSAPVGAPALVPNAPTGQSAQAPAAGAPVPNSVGAAATPGDATAQGTREAAANQARSENYRLQNPRPTGRDETQYVPGVQPSAPEISGNADDAARLKYISQEPGLRDQFQQRQVDNNNARVDYLLDTAGDPVTLNAMQTARDTQAQADLTAAFGAKVPTDAQPVVSQIQDILASPSGKKDAVSSALNNVLGKLYDADGNLETDPEILYGVRQHVADLLGKNAQSEKPSLKDAASQLVDVKNTLDQAIEQGAPGYNQYLQNYAAASRPIDTASLLQDAVPRLLNGADRNMTFASFDRFMKGIVDQRQSPGVQPAKSIDDPTMERLWNLHADLQRQQQAINAAKTAGSDTTSLFRQGMAIVAEGAGHLGAAALTGGNPLANLALRSVVGPIKQARQANRLRGEANRLLNPQPSENPPN